LQKSKVKLQYQTLESFAITVLLLQGAKKREVGEKIAELKQLLERNLEEVSKS
jgi:hypothetical protein